MQLQELVQIFLRGPAMAQVFVAVFLLYLVWALHQHFYIAFWLALIAAVVFHVGTSRNSTDATAPASTQDPRTQWLDASMQQLPELLLKYVQHLLPIKTI